MNLLSSHSVKSRGDSLFNKLHLMYEYEARPNEPQSRWHLWMLISFLKDDTGEFFWEREQTGFIAKKIDVLLCISQLLYLLGQQRQIDLRALSLLSLL